MFSEDELRTFKVAMFILVMIISLVVLSLGFALGALLS